MDSDIYNILNPKSKSESENFTGELQKIVNINIQKYNEITNSCDIIKEIYNELQEKQNLYINHIEFLENLQSEVNKLFIEISKKKF
jgi:hypothetical protein